MCDGRAIRIIDVMIPDVLAILAAVLGAAGLLVLVVGGAAAAILDEGA